MPRSQMRTGRKYELNEVLSKLIHSETDNKVKERIDFDGDLIKVNSLRLTVFKEKGTKCVECGIEGQYFIKEKSFSDKSYHFNLYAVNNEGEEVLMTKDHIIPRSKGGPDHIDNMQTMCYICNERKGDTMPELMVK